MVSVWGPQGHWSTYGYASGLQKVLLFSMSLGSSSCIPALQAEKMRV